MAEQKLSQEIEKKKAEIQKVSDQFGKVAESCKVNYDDYMANFKSTKKPRRPPSKKHWMNNERLMQKFLHYV